MTGGAWVWVGLTWTARVRQVLDLYGDRLTDVSIFGWRVNAAGALTQIFDPSLLDAYRAKWPHIRWWLCVMNDGAESVFTALRNDSVARAALATNIEGLLDTHTWAHGIDMDLERGGALTNAAAAEALFTQLATAVHGKGRKINADLPGMDQLNGSVGGENWCRYAQLGQILDHVCIMSYGMAWAGSAPAPVSPRDWLEGIYNYAATQIAPAKVSMGLPAYGFAWRIHNYPPFATIESGYRASTATYYGARLWLDGAWVHDPAPQPHIPWLAFRDEYEHAPVAYLHVYDWCHATDFTTATGMSSGTYQRRPYTVRPGRTVGQTLWSVANNTDANARAVYTIAPRQFRDRDGNWATPNAGLTLTLESLKRVPESATIWDDDFRTEGIVATSYYNKDSGSWSQWPATNYDRSYGQARVANGGTMNLGHGFGTKALHVQARLQLPAVGRAGVHIGSVRAEISNTGALRLMNGSTVIASASVTAPGISTTPGSGLVVIGLRVRGTHARLYYGTSETNISLRLEGTVPSGARDGSVGLWANRAAWFDHLRVGDGWWYQPREAFRVQLGLSTWTVGRIPRTNVTWNTAKNVFRPNTDVEEYETRTRDISLDWDFDHQAVPILLGETRQVTIRPLDIDCWLGRVFLCDSEGASILWYADAEHIAWWADRAHYDWGLDGFALWSLGQEDVRLWERLVGALLPQSAAV